MTILHMDCRDAMRIFPANSFDSIVCDPPYEIGMMNKKWDSTGIAYDVDMWREALRVLKPGGHLLAFGSARTYHRIACAIEDAGFEVRDQIMWVYATGFPKSMDVSKAINKAAGAVREVVGFDAAAAKRTPAIGTSTYSDYAGQTGDITAPATDAARQWDGWGTALKPAHEPIVVARKPFPGTVADNVMTHGTGAINIDGCRVENGESTRRTNTAESSYSSGTIGEVQKRGEAYQSGSDAGRWPANLIHDGSPEVAALFPNSNGAGGSLPQVKITGYGDGIGTGESTYIGGTRTPHDSGTGSAARFFKRCEYADEDVEAARLHYCAKASRAERDAGLESFEAAQTLFAAETGLRNNGDGTPRNQTATRKNTHPTVKPLALMRYLCRLVTPPGGVIFDPFAGSGSTGVAAIQEGFTFVGSELDETHVAIATARINAILTKPSKD